MKTLALLTLALAVTAFAAEPYTTNVEIHYRQKEHEGPYMIGLGGANITGIKVGDAVLTKASVLALIAVLKAEIADRPVVYFSYKETKQVEQERAYRREAGRIMRIERQIAELHKLADALAVEKPAK